MEKIYPEVKGELENNLIVITPHSSTYIPTELEDKLAIEEDEKLRFTDLYADELYDWALNIGGVVISAPVSRFVVQLNKMTKKDEKGKLKVWDKKLKYLDEADPKNADGSFITYSWTGNKVFNPELTDQEKLEIFDNIYTPWLEVIDEKVAEAQEKFGYSLLIDGHTFPSVSATGKPKNADFILGTRDFTTADRGLISKALDSLVSKEYLVGNDMYGWGGGYTTGHYGQKASPKEMKPKGIDPKKAHAIQIETNKKLYMDEKSFEKNSNFDSTKNTISSCLSDLVALMHEEFN